ncbi:ras-related protein Rab-36-like [Paramacrobiotus metropolitanus]|uniref:ras-related protein Rab-36-like n=1 Tax=Paramacrobiotus metropolitanus TaxID=2943436 RepID=UPI0024462029|nr:ras-related protein Rab-36-like [Paramacrobiotus metropolitanus]
MTKKLHTKINTDEPYINEQAWSMIRAKAKKDRSIDSFSRAYRDDATPYSNSEFSSKVRELVAPRKKTTIDSELNIAKLILVGDVSVGKTSLVHRFCHDLFNRDYKATIGVDFEVERFDILEVPFTLQVWDTAGQERFKSIAASYYRGANVVVVTFDLSESGTLDSCQRWLNDALEGNTGSPHIFLVGTKKDLCSLDSFRRIEEKAVAAAKEFNAEFWPVSSKSGENVQALFFRIACMAFDAMVLREIAAGKTAITPKDIAPSIKLTARRLTPREYARRILKRTKCSKS